MFQLVTEEYTRRRSFRALQVGIRVSVPKRTFQRGFMGLSKEFLRRFKDFPRYIEEVLIEISWAFRRAPLGC